MLKVTPRRSALFMPGSNARAIEKAKSLLCDTVIFDLEDAVAPGAKLIARQQVVHAVKGGGYGSRELVVRINGLDTSWWHDDLAGVLAAKPDAILLPKVESAEQIKAVEGRAQESGIQIWAMLETPLGFLRAEEIAASSPQLEALVIGPNDLVKELRARRVPGRGPILHVLSQAVLVARAYGKIILDGVYNDFRDDEGFCAECIQARDMGFDGKTLIHPNQIAGANDAFAPSADEVMEARELVNVYEAGQQAGEGAVSHKGKMIEELHAVEARRVIAMAEAIQEKAEGA